LNGYFLTTPTSSETELDFALLCQLETESGGNQRDLARRLGVSVGKINFCLRAVIDRGWVKVNNFRRADNKLAYAYLLTPSGARAKMRLAHTFLAAKEREFETLQREIEILRHAVDASGNDHRPQEHDQRPGMHTVTISSGKSYEARAGEALLDAALRQGVLLGYSCRTGRCSSCRGQVRSGETIAKQDEIGLSAEDKARGFILTCVREACGPVELEIEDLGDVHLPEAKTLPCRIQSLEQLSHDVVRVMLRLPPTAQLDYLPGQYIDVIGPEGLRRSYSIANAPQADKQIELHIREVAEGAMSRYWFQQAKANDLLRLRGPLGTFFLRGQAGRDLVMLATGTGIAPVKAMLEGMSNIPAESLPRSTTVYWGGRQAEDLYWPGADLPNLRFVPVLSRASEAWTGARGHVQDVMLGERGDLANTLVYACGSEAMIRGAQAKLQAAGLPEGRFHSDAFVCSAAS
jgi:CDP-4-dehydro-6-deoxyglucose reductase